VIAMKWPGYAWAAGAIATCTLAGLLLAPWLEQVNIALVYLLGVVLVALRWRRGPVVAASILVTFAMMLAVGLIVSRLTETVRARAQAQAELAIQAETERIRNALLSSISHDLRTPLAVIVGASSSLAEGGERMAEEERRALAHSIFRESQGMSELVAKVLQMTRLESGGLTLERDWCAIGEIAASVVRRLKPRLADHLLMVDMPGDLPLARVDGALIEQALANLLENAARHTPPRTLVRLRAHVHANELVVSVEDFGPGLPEGDLESLFDKFRHGGRGGVGLGLAICRAIVALHGGRIWAERLPGVGTAFRFALPLETAPEMPVEALAR
jgi:two-component system sensor histidine kinase KdpD